MVDISYWRLQPLQSVANNPRRKSDKITVITVGIRMKMIKGMNRVEFVKMRIIII